MLIKCYKNPNIPYRYSMHVVLCSSPLCFHRASNLGSTCQRAMKLIHTEFLYGNSGRISLELVAVPVV